MKPLFSLGETERGKIRTAARETRSTVKPKGKHKLAKRGVTPNFFVQAVAFLKPLFPLGENERGKMRRKKKTAKSAWDPGGSNISIFLENGARERAGKNDHVFDTSQAREPFPRKGLHRALLIY